MKNILSQTKHYMFVSTPLSNELEKALCACSVLDRGMNNYPLKEYMFHSLFLNLTGFQEQKLKCICWDLATEDYPYRRILLKNEDQLGEYSSLEDKSNIYRRIVNLICDLGITRECINDSIGKQNMAEEAKEEVVTMFEKTLFQYWKEDEFYMLKSNQALFKQTHFGNNGLLENCLKNVYLKLYKARNAYAHNVFSYQENVPTLRALATWDRLNDNMFVWFALLNLLDKLFSKLYFFYFDSVVKFKC